MSCKVIFCPCCAHLTSASDADVAVEQGGVVRRPVLVALHTPAIGVVERVVRVPGQHGGEDSQGRLGE